MKLPVLKFLPVKVKFFPLGDLSSKFPVNANECLMTRIQEMSMDYHFKVEQESGSSTLAFFGFNGEKLRCKRKHMANKFRFEEAATL